MKLYKGLILSLAVTALAAGCSKEDPFDIPADEEMGQLLTSSLAPSLTNPEGYEAVTRATVPSTDDFKVVIIKQGGKATKPTAEYTYSEMPEVLSLPVGKYVVYAEHGDNKETAWDEPYYYGESSFTIKKDEVTDDVEPIVAKLANVRVTIVYHASLASAMSNDCKVDVKMGEQGTVMTFAPGETRSAYFKYVDQSQTLAATFSGTVDGGKIVQTKTHQNVAPGNHYRITFMLHGINEDDPGTVSGSLTVDATVEREDMNLTVDGGADTNYETDDLRPSQGDNSDPEPGPGPNDEKKLPSISSAVPNDPNLVPVDLDKVNPVTGNTYCVLEITSYAEGGIEEFNVIIDSEKLDSDELEGMGLATKLDLVNSCALEATDAHKELLEPGALEEVLSNLEFPVNVGTMKNVSFNITKFLPMLSALGKGTHNFVVTVKDANGSTTKTLTLQTN